MSIIAIVFATTFALLGLIAKDDLTPAFEA